MAVVRSSDSNKSDREKVIKLLSQLVDNEITDTTRKQITESLTKFMNGHSSVREFCRFYGLEVKEETTETGLWYHIQVPGEEKKVVSFLLNQTISQPTKLPVGNIPIK